MYRVARTLKRLVFVDPCKCKHVQTAVISRRCSLLWRPILVAETTTGCGYPINVNIDLHALCMCMHCIPTSCPVLSASILIPRTTATTWRKFCRDIQGGSRKLAYFSRTPELHQILTNFKTYFTDRIRRNL